MSKRLFEVEISATIFVVAEDEDEAEDVGMVAVSHDPDSCGLTASVGEMIGWDARCVPSEWREVIPFGADEDDDRTVADWVQEMLEEEKAEELRKLQVPLPIDGGGQR